MRNLRLISTTAAILLLGAGTVWAQGMKSDETPAVAPAAQQNAPAETVAPALKSSPRKVPETTGQGAPTTAPEADKTQLKSQTMDKPTAAAAPKNSSDVNSKANVKTSATENGVGAASPYRKATDESKRSTTGQGAANENVVVGGPAPVRIRHHRHYRHCWPNIFNYGRCW